MKFGPKTRESLLLRLPSASDVDAWREFVAFYDPMIYRFARRQGLQDADALELTQSVLIAIAKAIDRWKPDQREGSFRGWLYRIAKNQLINMLAKRRPDRASGLTGDLALLGQIADKPDSDEELLLEYRREMFRMAAARVRDSFQANTWHAFWDTSVLAKPVEVVAKERGMTPGAVYIARSRVIHRLKETIHQWESHDAM